MSKKIRNNPLGINMDRRLFLKGAAAGLAATALPAAAGSPALAKRGVSPKRALLERLRAKVRSGR